MKISLRGGGIDSLVKSIESLETELDYTILFESLESPAALPPQSIETLPYNDKIEFLQALQTPLNLNALLDSIPTPPQKGWEKVKMQSLAKSLSAGGDKPKVFSESKTQECPIPIYANSTQNKGLYGYTDKATITQNAITISARGSIGYAVARYEPFMPIVRLIVLIPDEKIANLRFLEFSINNNEIQNSASNIPQLTVPEFANIQIPPATA
ncbi:restriction endonuclease subunit S [Campylobacter avium]|uniref:restriction endonuclease subunit S n=1 Tax=Campylobacter avium TaxID=522485 RepID=UPI00255BE573|nr:restriction endonuclease subunit S [Campylobacter avium]